VTGFAFRLEARDGRARAARLRTPHGDLETPLFAPVGTQATVKALTPAQIEALGASLILANTYHLHLRPGADVVERMGGLHAFMAWPHPILTDSGGYQVFSLADRRRIDSGGVTFHSHLDGSPLSQEDLTDMALLRLDAMASIEVNEEGTTGRVHVAHILPGPLPAGESGAEEAPNGSASGRTPPWEIQSFPILFLNTVRLLVCTSFRSINPARSSMSSG